jgi:hypothetical protein
MAQQFGSLFALWLVGFFILFPIRFTAQRALRTTMQAAPSQMRSPVLVELFTAEGCSSCPPADLLLGRLVREQPVPAANIIVLEEHVDYWENGGWHDRFSSSKYTERQQNYAPRLKVESIYTPQMVVDGSVQFLGNDPTKALHSIAEAAQTTKIALSLTAPVIDGNHIGSSVSTTSALPLPKGDLYAVLVDNTASTDVRGGENKGRHLEHVSVVRSFQRIGKLEKIGSSPLLFQIDVPSGTTVADMSLIVFAQDPYQGIIRGAISASVKQ